MKKRRDTKKRAAAFFLTAVVSVLVFSGIVWAEEEGSIADADTVGNSSDIAGPENAAAAGESEAEALQDTESNDTTHGDLEEGGTELPSYLEPTHKIDKLELTKREPVTLYEVSVRALSFTPQTGDEENPQVMLWIGGMVAAVLAAVIIIIWKKRK